jgi:hypothetical protein
LHAPPQRLSSVFGLEHETNPSSTIIESDSKSGEMMLRTLLLTSLCLCLPPTAIAAEPLPTARLLTNPFSESYQPEVTVSGTVVVGVMTGKASTALTKKALPIGVGEQAGGSKVCLSVASQDGTYRSQNLYELPDTGDSSDIILLPYASERHALIAALGSDSMAIAARAGDCDSASDAYYLARVSADDDAPVLLNINSFGATDTFYRLNINGEWSDPEACDYLTNTKRIEFDFSCIIARQEIRDATSVEIMRERFGRPQPAVKLTIRGAQ